MPDQPARDRWLRPDHFRPEHQRQAEPPTKDRRGRSRFGQRKRYADVLYLARGDLDQHVQAADRFRATMALGGARVLVIDDTWTTGANAQSASAALRLPGPGPSLSAIGRWFNPG